MTYAGDDIAFTTAYLNEDPLHYANLGQFLPALRGRWYSLLALRGIYPSNHWQSSMEGIVEGDYLQFANLDDDDASEIVMLFGASPGDKPTPVVVRHYLLSVFDQSANGRWQSTVYTVTFPLGDPEYGSYLRLQRMADINGDSQKEIVLVGGALYRFQSASVFVLKWQDGAFHELLTANLVQAQVEMHYNPRTRADDTLLKGGQVGIAGFGL